MRWRGGRRAGEWGPGTGALVPDAACRHAIQGSSPCRQNVAKSCGLTIPPRRHCNPAGQRSTHTPQPRAASVIRPCQRGASQVVEGVAPDILGMSGVTDGTGWPTGGWAQGQTRQRAPPVRLLCIAYRHEKGSGQETGGAGARREANCSARVYIKVGKGLGGVAWCGVGVVQCWAQARFLRAAAHGMCICVHAYVWQQWRGSTDTVAFSVMLARGSIGSVVR